MINTQNTIHIITLLEPPTRMSAHPQIVEHVVLFNFKPDVDSTRVATMIDEMKGLASLDVTLYLSVGKILRYLSSSLSFSHIVHCRFSSTESLQAYDQHPEHVRLAESVIPLFDDFVIVDWISDGGSNSIKPGSVMRVTLLKLKEDLVENEKGKFVKGLISKVKTSENIISVGESLSYELSKGYSIAMITVFDDVEAVDSYAELANLQESRKDFVESEVVIDYVVPLS